MIRDPILFLVSRLLRGHLNNRKGWRHRASGWVFRNYPGMIDCGTFEGFLMDYHEGTLAEEKRQRFERHLHMCGLCRASYRSYEHSIEIGKRLFETESAPLPDDVPPELVDAVLNAMQARSK